MMSLLDLALHIFVVTATFLTAGAITTILLFGIGFICVRLFERLTETYYKINKYFSDRLKE